MDKIIEIKGVNVYYENVCALQNINLEVYEKDFLAILGPNGGGKSTLLKLILGFVENYTGEVKILGKDNKVMKECIGYVPQITNFDRKFPISITEVIMMAKLSSKPKLFLKHKKDEFEKVYSIMESLGLYHLRDRQIGELSGGQLQKVLIARALFREPKLLLLDEPTSSLDGMMKSQIFSILKELNKDITIIIVTHDLSVISSYVKNIACLNKRLYYHGETKMEQDLIKTVYGCPVDLIAHGVPHRVLNEH